MRIGSFKCASGTPSGLVKKQGGRWIGMLYADGARKSKSLSLVKDMSKSDARAAANRIVTEVRKWKWSTRENNVNRVSVHLVVSETGGLSSIKRDELQDPLDAKANGGLSFSVVDHRR
jgi:hypothetical protein